MLDGLYIHIPFCARRCHYCDFNTYEGMEGLREDYTRALLADMRLAQGSGPLKSVFFGGGTPSLMEPGQVARILEGARERCGLEPDAEVTLEANPGTADLQTFRGFRAAGVTRLSFGFQALQAGHLERLGRIHTAEESAAAWRLARQADFSNLSLDLMFGLPDQSLAEWEESLDWALSFEPEHLSFYGLTLESGTRFHHLASLGQLPVPGEDLQADMYEQGIARLARAGLEHYEISNFARPGRQSRHNRLYWLNRPTLGIGAGAWSFVEGRRFSREKNPNKYVEAVLAGQIPVQEQEQLEGRKARGEAAYLGLRLLEGIDLERWRQEKGLELHEEFGQEIKTLIKSGLLSQDQGRLKLSSKGLPLANEVFSAFV